MIRIANYETTIGICVLIMSLHVIASTFRCEAIQKHRKWITLFSILSLPKDIR